MTNEGDKGAYYFQSPFYAMSMTNEGLMDRLEVISSSPPHATPTSLQLLTVLRYQPSILTICCQRKSAKEVLYCSAHLWKKVLKVIKQFVI